MEVIDSSYPFESPCLIIDQPFGEFVVASIPARILLDTSYSDRLTALLQDDGSYRLEGSQRELLEPRLKAIGSYLDKGFAAFPNSIILAANYREIDGLIEEDDAKAWVLEQNSDDGTALLRIPQPLKLAAIIDGQHRLFGFNYTTTPGRMDMQLVCAIYFGLPKTFQAFLFATVNANQKAVSKSQTYELFGYNLEDEIPSKWTPENLAVFFARKLNSEVDSPFYKHILVPAENDFGPNQSDVRRKVTWAVSTATVVEGIIRLLSSNPKRDSYKMAGSVRYEGHDRSILERTSPADKSPLRQLFLSKSDDLIYRAVRNYFLAADNVFWSRANADSYIIKTVGIQALFDVLRELAPIAVEQHDLREQFFNGYLHRARKIDFSHDFFQASGTGRQRIRNSLQLSIGLKSIEQIVEEDRRQYNNVCGLNGV